MKAPALTAPVAAAAWWTYTAFRIIADARRDVGPTGLRGDLPNWHNQSGDMAWYLTLTILELAAVIAVLRPLSYRRSWRRALTATVLLTPWILLFLVLMIHSGGIMVIHFIWLVGLWFGTLLLAAVSGMASFAARERESAA